VDTLELLKKAYLFFKSKRRLKGTVNTKKVCGHPRDHGKKRMYCKYEKGMWTSKRSWEEEMEAILISEIQGGASYESEIEICWQLTGLEFDEADEELIKAIPVCLHGQKRTEGLSGFQKDDREV